MRLQIICKGGRAMKTHDKGCFSSFIKTVFFSLLLALAGAGYAQENTAGQPETVSVEAEQVNINKADAETIARVLNGIGISRAEAIVTYREEFGEFTSMDDLMMVKGVGEVTVRNNQDRISFK